MSEYSDLVSKLVSVANTDFAETSRLGLLNEAIAVIGALRKRTGTRPADTVRDALNFLKEVSASMASGTSNPEAVRTALLDGSAMIRDLEQRWLGRNRLRPVVN